MTGDGTAGTADSAALRVALVRLPHCTDFSEFDALGAEPGVDMRLVTTPDELGACDLVVLPGTERTIPDLEWLRESGMLAAVEAAVASGALLFGICGGFQMFGAELLDPDAVEGPTPRAAGLGLFDVTTTFTTDAIHQPVTATGTGGFLRSGEGVTGYELHGGRSVLRGEEAVRLFEQEMLGGSSCPLGLATRDYSVMGTYLHGVLSDATFRAALLDHLLTRRLRRG
jgi:adenosylcobyric acid synthase